MTMARTITLALLALSLAPSASRADGKRVEPAASVPRGLRCLWQAYPKHLCAAEKNTLIWCDGTRMTYDDGRRKPGHRAVLDDASLKDQMAQRYPAGARSPTPPPKNFDPGRARHEPFFRKMYGSSRKAVLRNTRRVRWMSRRWIRVTRVNGVDRALEAVSRDLSRLPKLRKYVHRLAGAFNWRRIRGTRRLSTHSFGVALDINLRYSDYWRWARRGPGKALRYRNRIPMQIVRVFEKHGFIWGGKWYHFDTMHFEYRPELLQPGCAETAGKAGRKKETARE